MLSKLLKYEFKSTARTFGTLYLALLAASVVVGFYTGMESSGRGRVGHLGTILGLVYVVLFVALGVITLMSIIQRFTRNLLGREGYLMHTLPVSARQLIGAKLITAVVWCACSVLIACVSLVLFMLLYAAGCGNFSFDAFWQMVFDEDWSQIWASLNRSFEMPLWQVAAILVIGCFVGCTCLVAEIYASCMVGHQVKKHPAIAGIGTFLGLSLVQSWIQNLASAMTIGAAFIQVDVMSSGASNGATFTVSAWGSLAKYAAVCLVFIVLYFALTEWLMKDRLNLE